MFTEGFSGVFGTLQRGHRYGPFDLRYHLILWSWSCGAVVFECSYVRRGGWKEVASERATRQKSLSEVAWSETGLIDEALESLLLFFIGGVITHHVLGPIFCKRIKQTPPLEFVAGLSVSGGFFWIPGTWMSSRFEASRCFKNSWRSFRRNSRAFPGRCVFPVI